MKAAMRLRESAVCMSKGKEKIQNYMFSKVNGGQRQGIRKKTCLKFSYAENFKALLVTLFHFHSYVHPGNVSKKSYRGLNGKQRI